MTQQENKQRPWQVMKRYMVFAAMFIAFGMCMWWIFAPSTTEQQAAQAQAGFNASIPDPEGAAIVADKKSAYEAEQLRLRQEQKMRTLEEYAFSLGRQERIETEAIPDTQTLPEIAAAAPNHGTTGRYGGYAASRQNNSLEASDAAYRQLGNTLGNFYDTSHEDVEKERLRAEVEALRESTVQPAPTEKNGKALVLPVGTVEQPVVSALQQTRSDTAWLAEFAAPRPAFHTSVGDEQTGTKNTICACVDCNQTLTDGQSVRLRLMEQMRVGNLVLPRNTLIVGTGKIEGERLGITVTSIEYAGTILPVELSVYDSGGRFPSRTSRRAASCSPSWARGPYRAYRSMYRRKYAR